MAYNDPYNPIQTGAAFMSGMMRSYNNNLMKQADLMKFKYQMGRQKIADARAAESFEMQKADRQRNIGRQEVLDLRASTLFQQSQAGYQQRQDDRATKLSRDEITWTQGIEDRDRNIARQEVLDTRTAKKYADYQTDRAYGLRERAETEQRSDQAHALQVSTARSSIEKKIAQAKTGYGGANTVSALQGELSRFNKIYPQQGRTPYDGNETPEVKANRANNLRADGSTKGPGWDGKWPLSDGSHATEYSRGGDVGGTFMEYPLIYPGMTEDQKARLKTSIETGGPIDEDIERGANSFAVNRVAKGLSPFKEQGEASGGAIQRIGGQNTQQTGGIEYREMPGVPGGAIAIENGIEYGLKDTGDGYFEIDRKSPVTHAAPFKDKPLKTAPEMRKTAKTVGDSLTSKLAGKIEAGYNKRHVQDAIDELANEFTFLGEEEVARLNEEERSNYEAHAQIIGEALNESIMNANLKGDADEIKEERELLYEQLDSAMKVSPRQKMRRAIDKSILGKTGFTGWLRDKTGAEFTQQHKSRAISRGISAAEKSFRDSGLLKPDGTTNNKLLEKAATRTLAEMSTNAKRDFAGDLLKEQAGDSELSDKDIEESLAIKYLMKREIEDRVHELIPKGELGGSAASWIGRQPGNIGRGMLKAGKFLEKRTAPINIPGGGPAGRGHQIQRPQKRINRIGRGLEMRIE